MANWKIFWSKCRQVALAGIVLFALQSGAMKANAADIHPQVATAARGGTLTSVLVVLKRQANLSAASRLTTKAQKGAFVYHALRAMADGSQPSVLAHIRAMGLQAQPFWIMNAIVVTAPAQRSISSSHVQALAAIDEIANLQPADADLVKPVDSRALTPVAGPQPNIEEIGAPAVWRSGHTGQGIVVGSIDTGVAPVPDLVSKYRGYTGPKTAANHDYNWFDAATSCTSPCDGNGHGTHTTGTMVGSNEHVQVGVAPGAQWIACRALNNAGTGTIAAVLKCMEFMLAPTKRNGQDPEPSKAADVVNNSYGGTTTKTLTPALDALYAADIMMIAAAGNTGPGCRTGGLPAVYDKVVSVGATILKGDLPPASTSTPIAPFSSRGSILSNVIKPDLVAPGTAIVSLNLTGGYVAFSGTSMASSHVAGAVALLWSARPDLRGNITATYNALAKTAEHFVGTTCITTSSAVPNNAYGWGFIRVEKAVTATGSSP